MGLGLGIPHLWWDFLIPVALWLLIWHPWRG